jgi:glucose-1-phosphate adenylyltransferase
MDTLGDSPKIDIENWGIRTNLDHRSIRDRIPTVITSSASINNSLVAHGCHIEGDVNNSILFPGITVEKGAVINNSILMFDSIVGEGSILDNVISDTDVKIGQYSYIGYADDKDLDDHALTVLGRNCEIPSDVRIGRNCTISPNIKPQNFKTKSILSGETI